MTSRPAHGEGEEVHTHGRTIGWWAPFYDAFGWLWSLGRLPGMRRETLHIAALQPGEYVLDVGCGTGVLTRLAAKEVAPDGKVVGTDASPQMIATARRNARQSRVEFQVAPIEQLPYESGRFDVVLSSLMLHHLPGDLKKAGLAEVRRVLKPGGRLVVMDMNRAHGPLGHMGHQLAGDYPAQLTHLLAECGFESVERIEGRYGQMIFIRAQAPAS